MSCGIRIASRKVINLTMLTTHCLDSGKLNYSRLVSSTAEHETGKFGPVFCQTSMLCSVPTKAANFPAMGACTYVRSHHCRGGTEDWEENLAAQIEAMIARESEAAAERVRVKRASIMKVLVGRCGQLCRGSLSWQV